MSRTMTDLTARAVSHMRNAFVCAYVALIWVPLLVGGEIRVAPQDIQGQLWSYVALAMFILGFSYPTRIPVEVWLWRWHYLFGGLAIGLAATYGNVSLQEGVGTVIFGLVGPVFGVLGLFVRNWGRLE